MTDDFRKGLITGLAMNPLFVTTETVSGTDSSTDSGSAVATGYIGREAEPVSLIAGGYCPVDEEV